ncbi:tRNA (adenosine(37)-N6)-dimethylallyltransferase MiaA [Galbibacter sp.]|uniref:tRNA (adenosine(37)-N6)-dimethylallyltransferase MiaA n=1 Tax=Galbibacter sp. TaxID=2918471 RepID=UPI002C29C596|nr:tRNA (adenosine(37)-N6)-dimethylallyltransferase MiaA [Galbibacter sp.]HLV63261.1 tRNA (adenosine(37)-N6)-dimethylallyltransferase MiaA [Galbibacter sp.]
MKHKTLITIVGPTAIGKTALAIAVAKYFNTEILSSDSRQFYKEMYIGTAVPDPIELQTVKHHFIQHISIQDPYSVGDFEKQAIVRLKELFASHQVVVMAGGSGLYNKAVIEGLDHFPKVDPGIRMELNLRLQENGIEALQSQLQSLDPISYASIDLQNPHRLIRALEVCLGTNRTFSSYLNQGKPQRLFNTIQIGLTADRAVMYERINKRVDLMMDHGLLDEVRSLYKYRQLNALQTVGYKELFEYIDGNVSYEFAVSEIKKNTRRFAKRQITWLKKEQNIHWFDYQTPYGQIINKLTEILKNYE